MDDKAINKNSILRGAKLQDDLAKDLKRAFSGYSSKPKAMRGKDTARYSQTNDPAVDKPNQGQENGLAYYMSKAKQND